MEIMCKYCEQNETYKDVLYTRGRKIRNVRFGRKWLVKCGVPLCFAHHWAVQVMEEADERQEKQGRGWWYEVSHKETFFTLPKIRVNKVSNNDRRMFWPCIPCLPFCRIKDESGEVREWYSCLPCYKNPSPEMGCCDERDAGCLGGEIVGKTQMTDEEIEVFMENWSIEKKYCVATTNCIKFAYELIERLTHGNFSISHSTVLAANTSENSKIGSSCINWDCSHGIAQGRIGAGDTRFTKGPFGLRFRFGPEFKAQFTAGLSGTGCFLNLSCNRVEFSLGWPWLGGDVHMDINMNTGLGTRNGNVELHILGFGGKFGTDGVEVNTPWIGGYNIGACFGIYLVYLKTQSCLCS